jgi:hypothetical protein
MNRAIRLSLALAITASSALVSVLPRTARADGAKSQPVYVLTLSTDDSDDQADALTQALRSRVRQSHGWSLLETPQSFETLSIALKCPPKPDAACLQRIGDQLHADHFVWGTLSKAGGGQVKADVHMWARGKSDVEATNVYSDNLKDASDESLRAISTTLFGTLSGGGPGGTVVVHAGNGGGDVLVDGSPQGTLEGGVARIDVPPGAHTLSVRVPGFDASPLSTTVAAGVDQELTFPLIAGAPPPADSESHGSFPVRKVLEYGAIVAGGVLLIVSGVETAQWISDSNQSNSDRQHVPKTDTDVCANQVSAYAQDACNKSRDATTVSSLGWVFGGVGAALVGTGVVLLLTDHPSSLETGGPNASNDSARPPRKASVDVLPSIGPQGGGMQLRVTF